MVRGHFQTPIKSPEGLNSFMWYCGAVGLLGCGWRGCVVVGLWGCALRGAGAVGGVGFGALRCVAVLGSVGLCGALWGCGAVGLWGCEAVWLWGCGAVGLWGCGAVGLWGWGCGVAVGLCLHGTKSLQIVRVWALHIGGTNSFQRSLEKAFGPFI